MQNFNDPRAVRTKQALQTALLELLTTKPFEQITIREITAYAGVGYTTFFRHHPTKESLLENVITEQVSCLINLSLPILDAQDLRSASEALFSYVRSHQNLWTTLLTGGAAGTIREQFLKLAREAAAPRAADGGKLSTELGVTMIVSGTIELLTWWLRQDKPVSVQEIAEIHETVVVTPVIVANYPDINNKSKSKTNPRKKSR